MRANAWVYNYEKRNQSKAMGDETGIRVLHAIDRFPNPVMDITGWLDKDESGNLYAWNQEVKHACDSLKISLAHVEMLVKWYWSEDYWMLYVKAFQSLPEPEGEYVSFWGDRCMPTIIQKLPPSYPSLLGVSGGKSALTPRISVLKTAKTELPPDQETYP